MKTDEQLKSESPSLYHVAREAGTEVPFTGKYVSEHASGMYHCAVCGAPLFSSDAKFDSGTGWPSFTDPAIAAAVTLVKDDTLGVERTEVKCAKCGAHLGHVFNDGPNKAEGGVCDRYCINSVSLNLVPKD